MYVLVTAILMRSLSCDIGINDHVNSGKPILFTLYFLFTSFLIARDIEI